MQLFEKDVLGTIKSLLNNSLKYLKDEEFQRIYWFNHEGPFVDSYGDACIYFIESCESIFKYQSCKDFLGIENYVKLHELYQLVLEHFRLVDSRMDPDLLQKEELLTDPKWQEIQKLAGETETSLTKFLRNKENEKNNI